jgi:putative transcriptional regulator
VRGGIGIKDMGKTQMKYKVANCIGDLRAEKGMSQEKLANEIGVTRATVNAVEKGNYNPSLDLAFRISVFFEKPIEEIFKIEGEYE